MQHIYKYYMELGGIMKEKIEGYYFFVFQTKCQINLKTIYNVQIQNKYNLSNNENFKVNIQSIFLLV